MKSISLIIVSLFCSIQVFAQNIYMSTSSKISFFAGTPVEDINADNTDAKSFLNIQTGEVNISIPNKSFHFKRSLMEEHFNENYMESSKYPKSEFKGKINHIETINFQSKDSIRATVTGTLSIHGVSKEKTINVVILSAKNKILGKTKFNISLAEFNIERPKILWEKIAENVDVNALFTYQPYKKP